ncbi:MAG: DNRLRE domain-containing protein [Anaerolineae bacterium]|nr:DNRLRE domain-containing protein [Anaerolineae bacterium]
MLRPSMKCLLFAILLAFVAVPVNVSAVDAPPGVSDYVPALAELQANDAWTYRGPEYNTAGGSAPQVTQVVIDPKNPNIVYAGTNQGVYRSSDGGETWFPGNGGLGGYGDLVISGLAIDPVDSNTLVIGTWGYGLLKSTDGGSNWSRLTDPLGSKMLDAAAEGAPPVIGGGPSLLHQHDELPAPEGTPISWQRTAVRRVTINPQNRQEIFACIDDGYGLYRSTNGGSSWAKITLGTGSARSYTFAPSNNQIRYASFGTWTTSGGFYRTTNGGSSWTDVGTGKIAGTVTGVAIHPTNSNIVMAATAGDGLYRSTNGGSSWTKVSGGLTDSSFYAVAISKSNPNIVYAGGYVWPYISTDGGASWAVASTSFPTYYVEGLAIHPTNSSTVYLGANYFPFGGVYKRTSTGSAFALKAEGMERTFVLDIEQDPNNSSILYASTWGAGIFRSDNGGVTWNARYGVPYVYTLEATQGPTGTILYAGTFYSDWGVLKSWDRGDHWTEVSRAYPSYISFDIASIQGDPNKLIAATHHGIQYSNDGGMTWNTPTGLTEGIVLRLCEFKTTGKLLAATYGGGLFYSSGGTTWSERNTGMTGTYAEYTYDVACSPDTLGVAYAGAYKAYKTTDYGAHWQMVDSGLPNDFVRDLDIASGSGDVFAGTNTSGVYLAPGGGNNWHAINARLTEKRIRSIKVVGTSPVKAFAGTNGQGGFEFTKVTGHAPLFLPLLCKSANQNPPPPANLEATTDATVLQGVANTNFGNTTDMWVGYDHCDGGLVSRSLVKFDVSAIPAGAQISGATFSVYLINSCDIGERTHTLRSYRVTGSWSESTVTWNNQPSVGESYGSVAVPSLSWGWYSLNVTNLVKGWVNGAYTNYGLALRSNESSGNDSARLGFATSEYAGREPNIVITYTTVNSPAPQTLVLTALSPASGDQVGIADVLARELPACAACDDEGLWMVHSVIE